MTLNDTTIIKYKNYFLIHKLLTFCDQQRIGVWTDQQAKEDYAKLMEQLLSHGRLHFADNLLSDNAWGNREALIHQMSHFHRFVKQAVDKEFGVNKVTYTGKASGRKDDLVLSLQICLVSMHKLQNDISFIRLCEEKSWRY